MAGIIGKKIGMTSVYNEDGKAMPCTVVEAGPCVVTQIRTADKDGYEAIQLGFGEKREKSSNAAEIGHAKKAKTSPKLKLVEFREFEGEYQLGDVINVDVFSEGDFVDAVGVSKGKGFQGVVKRHNFRGVGDATHGQHNRQRAPGSLGGASYPARVFKGLRMAGQTGGGRVTQENLRVVKIIPEKNLILLKGSVPGSKGSLLIVRK